MYRWMEVWMETETEGGYEAVRWTERKGGKELDHPEPLRVSERVKEGECYREGGRLIAVKYSPE